MHRLRSIGGMSLNPPRPRTRKLANAEIHTLLQLDIVAHLATVAADGIPRVIPIWFVWSDGAFYMTSVDSARHVVDLQSDPRAAICLDVEAHEPTETGVRPNASVRARGRALLSRDVGGDWTRRITQKYVRGEIGRARADHRASMRRTVIELRPLHLVSSAMLAEARKPEPGG